MRSAQARNATFASSKAREHRRFRFTHYPTDDPPPKFMADPSAVMIESHGCDIKTCSIDPTAGWQSHEATVRNLTPNSLFALMSGSSG